jgi:hypothetical protein
MKRSTVLLMQARATKHSLKKLRLLIDGFEHLDFPKGSPGRGMDGGMIYQVDEMCEDLLNQITRIEPLLQSRFTLENKSRLKRS